VGSQVKLTGLVVGNNTFISNIAISEDTPQVTEIEGQFEGTNQNGTSNISGISVNINSGITAPLALGDSVQLQGNTQDNKLNVTNQQSSTVKTTTITGVLTAVNLVNGTITVQLTGRQVKLDINNAQIQNFADTTTLKIDGLKLLIGHEIKLDGLSKNGNILSATLVEVKLVK
jgi:hypothetical protein